MLGVGLLRIFTRIQGNMGRLYKRECCFHKSDIPAQRYLMCLLTVGAHMGYRRRCTLDLSVVGTIRFEMISTKQIIGLCSISPIGGCEK
jgi:hypothetical protein